MSNEYYDHLNAPATGSQLSSAIVRAELDKIETGFDKLPTLATGANKLVAINSSGTAMVATDTPDINGGTIDGASFGQTVPGAVAATTFSASSSATVPTVAADTNTTAAASTAFVLGQASSASPNMDGAASAGASTRFARGDHTHPTDTSRAPVADPTFTGTVTAPTLAVNTAATVPTVAVDTNSTAAASTAFVLGQASSTSPAMDGSASAGTSTRFARADHVHPSDTSRAPVNNPTFTGTVTLAADPTANLQAATKQYVDGIATGLDTHTACRVATTANLASLSGLLTIDGVTVVASDRVLVKDQTTNTENGIYVAAAGAWSRATDADAAGELKAGSYVFVNEGTVNQKTGWTQTTTGTITPGSSAIVWSQFSSTQTYTAGTGLSLAGNSFSLSSPVAVANGGTGATSTATAPFAVKGANSDITSLSGLTTALSVAQGGTGATTLTGVLKGTGTTALAAATGTDVTSLIGTNAVTNATNAANAAVTDDTTTNATVYPIWATAASGNQAAKVSSTKLSFNPSTGVLTASGGFSGTISGNAATATKATNVAGGVAGAVHWQSAADTTGFTAAGTSGQALLSGGTGVPTWGTLGTAAGGTGATSVSAARTNLGVPATDGTGATGTWSINISGSAGSATTATTATNVSGTVAVANGGTGANTLTGILKGNGTAAFTAAAAGTDYVAPGGALGTPSSGNLANCTFPTLNQNTTGSAGSVAWTGVTGRPTALSAFTNDSGYVTSAGSVASATTATNANNVNVTTTATAGNYFLTFVGSQASGNQAVYIDSANGSYNPSTNTADINITGSAGSVAWTSVSGRPTAVSSFTNDSGYITSSGSISGSAGSVAWTGVTGRPTAVSAFTNDSGYITSAGTATNVSGTVTVGHGGTGLTTLTANAVLLGNGTSNLQAVSPSTSGNVLTSNGTTWVSQAPAVGVPSANYVVGSYILAINNSLGNQTAAAAGTTYAGSAITEVTVTQSSGLTAGGAYGSLSGTWMQMQQTGYSGNASGAVLFCRIS